MIWLKKVFTNTLKMTCWWNSTAKLYIIILELEKNILVRKKRQKLLKFPEFRFIEVIFMEKVIVSQYVPAKDLIDIVKEYCKKYDATMEDGKFYHKEILEKFDGKLPKRKLYPETPYIY